MAIDHGVVSIVVAAIAITIIGTGGRHGEPSGM